MNPFAVVGDPDQVGPARFDLDIDPLGERIDTVLHQLFDDAGGPLDHLARGDLVEDGRGKLTNP